MTHKDFVAYFRNIAALNVDLAHGVDGNKSFHRMDVSEVLANKMNSTGWQMILERHDTSWKDSGDNLQQRKLGAFIICRALKKTSDYDTMDDIFDAAEQIAQQIMLYIRTENELFREGETSNIIEFDMNSVELMPIGPILENHYGYRCQFSFIPKSTTLQIDTDKWL